MTLDPTIREADFRGSIKKYFLDTIETLSSTKVFFEELEEIPLSSGSTEYTKWCIIHFGRRDLGPVSEQQITIELFTKGDKEGDILADLVDTVMGYIIDETKPTGLVTIPYYNTLSTWTVIGGIIPFLQPSLGKTEGKDGLLFQSINLLCKWGGK